MVPKHTLREITLLDPNANINHHQIIRVCFIPSRMTMNQYVQAIPMIFILFIHWFGQFMEVFDCACTDTKYTDLLFSAMLISDKNNSQVSTQRPFESHMRGLLVAGHTPAGEQKCHYLRSAILWMEYLQ